jgi:DNA-binding GntR family transcriptional regulator
MELAQSAASKQLGMLERQTTAQLAYRYLRDAIHQGQFEPGQHLDPKWIAGQLGISRMPVREAMIRLETEGFISVNPYQGAEVIRLSADQVEEIYLVRVCLEGLATRYAAERLNQEHLAILRGIVMEMEDGLATNNYSEYQPLNRRFHLMLYEAAGIQLLQRIVLDLWDKAELYRNRFLSMPERASSIIREHRSILDALEAGDGIRAEQAMEQHLSAAKSALLARLTEEMK